MNKTVFLSSEILNWNIYVSSSSIGNAASIKRPYEIVAHSYSLINEGTSDFTLSDAISNLKRALNHRLKLIEGTFHLNSLKYRGMPKGQLELLEEYGLAKPYVIKKLMEIRNKIEHKDTKPPKRERCKELADITWYFLKSTDRLLFYIPENFEIAPNESPDEKYGGTVGINHSNKKINISGWFPINYISNKEQDKFLKVTCSTFHNGDFWKGKENNHHVDKTENDIWLIGKFLIDEKSKQIIIKRCLESY